MKNSKRVLILITMLLMATGFLFSDHLLRFPDIHGDTIAFVWGEDIWTVPATGGEARRLTFHEGQERFPRFSPDGTKIAFTGDYDGNTDVYVMNLYGGEITRVTYHPSADQVIGWHGDKILFSSVRDGLGRTSRLYLISPDGTGLEVLPPFHGSNGSFSPDGKKLAYIRYSRAFRTWKRYKGGTQEDVRILDLDTLKEIKATDFEGTDRFPMWVGDKIYFSSDRTRVLNIWAYDVKSGKVSQVTDHKDYDIRRPSEGTGKIIYEKGGELWVLNTDSGKTTKVDVKISADSPETRPYFKNVEDYITDYQLSPCGKKALITARGEVFTVDEEHGFTKNLSSECGSRERDAVWSPDGKSIAYLSDKNGEYNIYIADSKGDKPAREITDFKKGYPHTLKFSPDSKKLAYTDETLTLYYIDIKSGKITKVDKAEYEHVDVSQDVKPLYDYNWSPDSRYIAYAKMDENLVYNIYIYTLANGKISRVTETGYNDFNPVFSADGEHLFFISNRNFRPTFCDFQWEMVYKDLAGIFAITLKKDGPQVLPPYSLEKREKKDKKKKDVTVKIDFEGIIERTEMLPIPAGNYRDLAAGKNRLFYTNAENGDYNRFEFRGPGSEDLYAFDFKTRKQEKVIGPVESFNLNKEMTKIIYKRGSKIGIIPASANGKDKFIDLGELKFWLEPLKEWKQIFTEAWRLERDYYYEPNMHGLDWNAMKTKYGRLVDFASCRQDMRFIIGELIGELNTSHTYVFGGDRHRTADRVSTGMLGAQYKAETAKKLYKITKILREPDWTRKVFPPLHGPGINVKEGDYLLAVDGVKVSTDKNIYSYFVDKAGKEVEITVSSTGNSNDARKYVVTPLRSERVLLYRDWVEHNKKVVEKASNGKIGYLHFPDTYTGSTAEFPRYFAQAQKQGLVIDARYNAGGLDPDIFHRRLYNKVHSYWTRRYSHDQAEPRFATRAHLACLTNYRAGSGGDSFPYQFKFSKMGPVIGTKSWGGLVGVSMFMQMIDGGGLTAPDYRIYGTDGKWIIENEGVEPDIVQELSVEEMQKGYDAQLMKAVDYLMNKIKEEPQEWPKHPPFKVDK